MFFFNISMLYWEVLSFGATIRSKPYDLEVMGSNTGNSLSTYGGMAAYIYHSHTLPGGSLVHWVPYFHIILKHICQFNRYALWM